MPANSCPAQWHPWLQEGVALRIEAPRCTRLRLLPATSSGLTPTLIDAKVSALPSVGLCNLALSIWRPRSRSRRRTRLRRHGRRCWRGPRCSVPRRDPHISTVQPELLSLLTVPTETDESVVARKVIWKLHPVSQEGTGSVMSIA